MQQVNLYSDILKQQQRQSGLKLIIVALAGLAFLGLSFSGYELWDGRLIETNLQQAQLTLNKEQARLNALLANRPSQQVDALVLAEIERWQNSVNEASQTLQLLAGKEAVLSLGFSGYLQALANQSTPDVWLTAIHIDGQHGELRLEGSTFKPELIPQALQQLQQESAFKGQTFAKLVMLQSAKMAGQMDFTLSSSEQPLDAKDHAQ